MHMKALDGCFLIDDFGRQLVARPTLLNRWIVPLESRVDFMKLHTGKSFFIPFEELVIFSTNLEPEDLMDPAFLRRLPYKIEVAGPERGALPAHLSGRVRAPEFELTDEVFDYIVRGSRWKRAWNWRPISRALSSTRWWPPAGSWNRRRTSSRGSSTTPSTTCASRDRNIRITRRCRQPQISG